MTDLTPEELALFGLEPVVVKAEPELTQAAIIPPDAPANDANFPAPEKAKRKKKAEPVAIKSGEPVSAGYVNDPPALLNVAGVTRPNPQYVPNIANLRDQFALAALTGLRPALDLDEVEAYAKAAYAYADAMLAVRG